MSNPDMNQSPHLNLPPYDTVCDFVGNPVTPDFTAFFNGNQFMVLTDLFRAFGHSFPECRSVFYETLPPGMLAQQILHGGDFQLGTLALRIIPDVFAAGRSEMEQLSAHLETPVPYAQNHLALVLPQNNPAGITGLDDLGRSGVRVLMPNPQTEGIARLARQALEMAQAGLAQRVFQEKVQNRQTVFTTVHHRQTVDSVATGAFDVGVVWVSEAMHAASLNQSVRWLPFPPNANPAGRYYIAGLKQAPHPEAQKRFLQFIASVDAQEIYARYGFAPPSLPGAYEGF